ncbi:phytanoyl-CoA dioxygenase family protein [Deinococcus hopiensis]|uniref:Protein involved in biosynthesis of mitomycin antibiotics/polyketide fumonisin n=1 Tax=Deinococcus hopiensis KR-140 TaxID=695939 RepID=A0A1W1UEX5_9DEIO|nr:phytanoyl-CoA dioxygenase family protein [Deinococcus hopiensis]SMB79646.1 Protein involved in biosynthesis of mitomycin antibiotics/polyketide fumonisin [Deinococcus hopiensis KR-140]
MTAMNDKPAPSMSMSAEAAAPQAPDKPINATPYADPQYNVPTIMAALYGDGILGLKGAFSREWVAKLGEELAVLYTQALARPGGAVGRGTNRHYVEIHPEDISGFLDLITHPWVQTVCASVLGPNYKIVEIGFDVPNPGSKDQPWHRDFRAAEETLVDRRLNSLAFNLTTVDVEEDMGPFEIAPGTQWDDPSEYDHGMFPPTSLYSRYEALAQRKMPKMGDISVRSALTIHRGTANTSDKPRPVLVLGVDAPGAGHDEWHDLQFTRGYYAQLPQEVRDHLICRVVDELEPIVQGHTIEGLMMGDA